MDAIISDHAQAAVSNCVKSILKGYQDKGIGFPLKSNEIQVRFIGFSEWNYIQGVYRSDVLSTVYRSCVKRIKSDLDVNRKQANTND